MAIFNVTTSVQLRNAIDQARGNDTIRLAPGEYGAVEIKEKYSGTVTFVSADTKRPAVITSLNVQSSENIRFDNLTFDYRVNKSAGGSSPFKVTASSKVTFSGVTFDGDKSGGYAVSDGLRVSDSKQITVQNSEFSTFKRGAVFRKVTDLKVLNNEAHSISGDGMAFAQIQNGLIQGNHMHSMKGDPKSSYHKDAFQFWTTSTDQPTSNLTIRGNTIQTLDDSTQSIFFGNSMAKTNKNMYWRDIVIEDNVVVGGHYHGIYVEEANGLAIRNNVVVQQTGTGLNRPINLPRITVSDSSLKVTVSGNIAHEVPDNKAGWTVTKNTIVSKGYKVADKDMAVIKAPTSGASVAAPDKVASPAPDPTPNPPKVDSKPAPDTSFDGISVSDLAKAQSRAFYEALARDLDLDLRPNGQGGSTDSLVLAVSGRVTAAGSGDNILVGTQGADTFLTNTGDNIISGLGGADTFRFAGSHVRDGKTDVIVDANFGQGDKLSFRGYEANTFGSKGGGNPLHVYENGASVIADSVIDLRELVAHSPDVTARVAGNTLILEIAQRGGVHEIELAGLAKAYQAVDTGLF